MKNFIGIFLLAVFFASMALGQFRLTPVQERQYSQGAQPRRARPTDFIGVLQSLGDAPITVLEPQPLDGSSRGARYLPPQQNSAGYGGDPFAVQRSQGGVVRVDGSPEAVAAREAIRNGGIMVQNRPYATRQQGFGGQQYGFGAGYGGFGGVGGFGGGLWELGFPIFAVEQAADSLGTLIHQKFEDVMVRLGIRVLEGATGQGAFTLRDLEIEGAVGRDAGSFGNHTWQTAGGIVKLTYAFRDLKTKSRGFDGFPAALALSTIFSNNSYVDSAATVLAQSRYQKYEVTATAVLHVQILDPTTREKLFAGVGVGTDPAVFELVFSDVAGVYHARMSQPQMESLARGMIAGFFRGEAVQ